MLSVSLQMDCEARFSVEPLQLAARGFRGLWQQLYVLYFIAQSIKTPISVTQKKKVKHKHCICPMIPNKFS